LALIQTYPQLSNLLPTAKSAAKFKSASSKTIKGSEPPIQFFKEKYLKKKKKHFFI
jgi:hypothetical protein